MGSQKPDRRRACLAVSIAAIAVAALALSFYFQFSWIDQKASAVGGTVLGETEDDLTVRCLSPDVTVELNGFHGQVTFTNCFKNSQVQGLSGAQVRQNATVSGQTLPGAHELKLVTAQNESFRFAVLGDSQGKSEMLGTIISLAQDCDFIIHCGDITPSSRNTEFASAMEVFNRSNIPIFTTPGNHDARSGDLSEYTSRLGPAQYSFAYGGVTFAFVDSSDLTISQDEIGWLGNVFRGADRKVIVTHATSYDPFTSNHTLDPASCDRLQQFAGEQGVTAVFSGHVHAFYVLTVAGTDFVITGGAGGSLTNGVHHFIEVPVDPQAAGFAYEKIDLATNNTPQTYITVIGRAGAAKNMTFEDLVSMPSISRASSYENLYGNAGGAGTYKGPAVSSLIDLVGGMVEGDILKVSSSDGYFQEFGYRNAYPSTDWLTLQGDMILAVYFDGAVAPAWPDGPRIAFLPIDGLYSNTDCEATSYPGQGWSEYPSAGARWAKNVVTLEVVAG